MLLYTMTNSPKHGNKEKSDLRVSSDLSEKLQGAANFE